MARFIRPQFQSSAKALADVREDIGEAQRLKLEFKMSWNHAADQGELDEMRRCWAQLLGLRSALQALHKLEARFMRERQAPREKITCKMFS